MKNYLQLLLCTSVCFPAYAEGFEELQSILKNTKIPPIEVKVGLSNSFAEQLFDVLNRSSSMVNSNVDSFFSQLGASLPKVGPGIVSLGNSFGESMAPARNQIVKGTLAVAGIGAAAFLFKKLGEKYIKKYLFEPSLIEKRSSYGIRDKVRSFFKKSNIADLKSHMIISEQLEKDLTTIMAMTANIRNNGGEFDNVLLHGEPGTGKTLFAQLLAEHCGMDYAIIPAANVSQFLAQGTAVEELNNLFEWAARNKRGTIIFFDEAETFLATRSTLAAAAQNALGAFLSKTGTPSNKIMIICATNRPEILDSAVLSRFGMQVQFPLPDKQAREGQLALHIKKIFEKQTGKQVTYTLLQDPAYRETLAEKLDGCSGRTIQKFVNRLRQQALADNTLTITDALVSAVMAKMVAV